ncbi:hypothetical protein IFR04_003426 [Cadophora malorum]|uniref:Uncharacterized protein n=1 Tax=Cadophora malorum TaxID=108018 RepID=A0A8H8BTT2_9HELO|nr:hypothetical protein IFR04_003426 [Cadophora malorum]
MYQAWVHTEEQKAALNDRYERLQRNEELEDAWKSVDMERIQAVYQIVKHPGGIIVLPYRENKDDIKSHANGYHKSQESNMSLDIRYHSQNGPSHNSLRPQYLGNARIFDQTGLSLLNDTFWKKVWQDGTLVPRNIHARLIYSACGFFGTYTMYTRVYRGPREPLDPETRKIFKLVTNFTIEIQLEILEFLPLHRGDLEVRLHYPHLIPMWIKTIPVRYHRYITRLLSIDNLCLLGRYYWDDEDDGHKFYGNGVDVYRFVSLNYHPEETSRIHNQLATLRNMNGNDTNTDVVPQGNEPFWDDASKTLRQHLIRLFINDKENNLRESESDVRGRRSDQDIVPISCSRVKIKQNGVRKTFESRAPWTTGDDGRDGPGNPLAHDAVSTSQQLEYIAISRDWQIARRGAYIILEFLS